MLLTLYLEINNFNYIFSVREDDGQNNFKTIYNLNVRLEGITDNRISDLNKVHDIIKENIYIIEKKLKFTFKEIVIIIDITQFTTLISSWCKKGSEPTLKEPANTDKIIVGTSK